MQALEEKFYAENQKQILESYRETVLQNILNDENKLKEIIFKALETLIQQLPDNQKIMYIEFSPLQVSFLNHDYTVGVIAYGQEWYLEPLGQTCFSIGFLFEALETFTTKWLQDIKKYLGKIRACSIEQAILKELPIYNQYFTYFMIKFLRQWDETENFKALNKGSKLQVYWGNYKDAMQLVYNYEEEIKTEAMFKEALTKKCKENLIFSDWQGMTAKKVRLVGKDMSCMNIKKSDLESVNGSQCLAAGMNLKEAKLKNCYFRGCDLQTSDLTGCELEDVIFENCNLNAVCLEKASLKNVILVIGKSIHSVKTVEEWHQIWGDYSWQFH